jgi:hypothetical protein
MKPANARVNRRQNYLIEFYYFLEDIAHFFDDTQLLRNFFMACFTAGVVLWQTCADSGHEFHDFPVDQILVETAKTGLFFADHDNIGPDEDIMLIQPEAFPYQPFYPVAFHCRADFSGNSNSQTPG